ncbi:MAG TPA: glycoside hydrolase family 30 beta sandwich domain-containing protein [Ktedonobacteraceae bacterium]|jgi:O-glycosyl hydrolase|nr:glycoside hydrolase family 30 beta sandwich domain-containing protein [Ktedonobacteraceae bacterium]
MSWLTSRVNLRFIVIVMLLGGALFATSSPAQARGEDGGGVQAWLTTPDQQSLLQPQQNISFAGGSSTNTPTITVNDHQTYQQMDGFGASLTSSASVLLTQPNVNRTQVMQDLFDPHSGIGLSFLREPMGSSDLAPPQNASQHWVGEYTYDDVAAGQTDTSLSKFSIAQDNSYQIPSLLKQALRMNPKLKIMATPWSPPAWMKLAGNGWGHCTNCDGSGVGFYDGSNSWDNTTNDYVTIAFSGTQIKFYGVAGPSGGIGAFSIDGGAESMVDFYSPNHTGNTLLYTSPVLPAGQHTLKVRVTGNQNPSANWNGINPDRVDVISASGTISIDDSVMGTGLNQFNYGGNETASINQGYLNPKYYKEYARYFVDFIKAYQREGIPIYAVTPQNEPQNDNYMPTMILPATSQTANGQSVNGQVIGNEADFITNLAAAFKQDHVHTKLLAFDHNWDTPQYPSAILNSPAGKDVNGIAFHCYGGNVSAQEPFYGLKDIYETECAGGSWENNGNPTWSATFKDAMELGIGTTRNGSKTVVRWGLALDPNGNPHLDTAGACSTCRGVVSIAADGTVTRNSDYYALGQFSKFVVPGAQRIASDTSSNNLENVAFRNRDGSNVLVVYNSNDPTSTTGPTTFQVQVGHRTFAYTLAAGAAVTFKW